MLGEVGGGGVYIAPVLEAEGNMKEKGVLDLLFSFHDTFITHLTLEKMDNMIIDFVIEGNSSNIYLVRSW